MKSFRAAVVFTTTAYLVTSTYTAASTTSSQWSSSIQSPSYFNSQASKWQAYIQSPSSRQIFPESIYSTTGDVTTTAFRTSKVPGAVLKGSDATVTFDFGRQVSGYITVHFGAATTTNSSLGLAFTESKNFIGVTSDNSTDTTIDDGTLYTPANPSTTFTFPRVYARGSFRYLTVSNADEDSIIDIEAISTYFTASPHTADGHLRKYTGYFYSDDELLNRIWYAGAYTIQLCHIFANESRATLTTSGSTITTSGWANNATIASVDADAEVFVDGAKRDRTPWPGDYGVAVLSKTISVNNDNLESVRNAVVSLYALQNASNGQFAYAGSPLAPGIQYGGIFSDTYHLWTLIALADYTTLSGDTTLITSLWDQAVLGLQFILNKVDSSDSLLDVTATYDWGRIGQGGKNIAANSLLYQALVLYAKVAEKLGLSEALYNGTSWSSLAQSLKSAINDNLWDESAGLYRDNTTSAGAHLFPQDGNSLAVHFNVTMTAEQAAQVSTQLSNNWNEFGSVAPEGAGSISPFITSLEIDAHLKAQPGDASLAMEILRRQWGYMLNHFSNSTLIEGYYKTGGLEYPFYGIGHGSYISLAHAWSTGPIASLSLRIGGLAPVSDGGKTWAFQPHAAGSGVGKVQTGYTVAAGSFSVEWTTTSSNKKQFFYSTILTPKDTTGTISVPTFGKAINSIQVIINGHTVWKNGKAVYTGYGVATATDNYITVASVSSGGYFSIVGSQ